MKIEIDKHAGFCFGVTRAIKEAEENSSLGIACLGQIVHNAKEEKRLNKLGMKTVTKEDFPSLAGKTIMIRAHGEPPETYTKAENLNIKIIDATCPVVLKLQQQIKEKYNLDKNSIIVIYGKKGHAEVNGLVGQTNGEAIVIGSIEEAKNLDVSKNIYLFSQTTSDYFKYQEILNFLEKKSKVFHGNTKQFKAFQTICPSVKNRIPKLKDFCLNHDIIIFVSDSNSSNGKMLFGICKETNKNSFFVTSTNDIDKSWFANVKTVGISGATSTPFWLIENIKTKISSL